MTASINPDTGTYARAVLGYDDAHREALISAIIAAIAKTSLCSDANVQAIRTGEVTDALVFALVCFIALSPQMSTPAGVRRMADNVRKIIIRDVPKTRNDPDIRKMLEQTFSGFHSQEGNA